MPDVLEVGDVMRWSSALVEQLRIQPIDCDVLVQVQAITREADGTVSLRLTTAVGDGSEIKQ